MITNEDAALAEEIAKHGHLTRDPEGFDSLDALGQWARVLARLRSYGFEVRKVEPSDGPDLTATYKRIEPKVQELLRRMAPPGTAVTPELVKRVQDKVLALIVHELIASGVAPTAAQSLGALMSAAIHIREKKA